VSLHLPLLDCDGHIAVNYLFSLATFRGDQELEKILEEIDLDLIPNETRRPFFAKATRRPLSATATIPFITPLLPPRYLRPYQHSGPATQFFFSRTSTLMFLVQA
jgi:hypothetical protein